MMTRSGLHEQLVDQHRELERTIDRMVEAYESGDRELARQVFREFDRRLSSHLAMEQELLHELATAYPAGVEEIEDEHRAIRKAVDEAGVGTDLHLTRAHAIRKLADVLRAHVRREDLTLYRWADEGALPARLEHR